MNQAAIEILKRWKDRAPRNPDDIDSLDNLFQWLEDIKGVSVAVDLETSMHPNCRCAVSASVPVNASWKIPYVDYVTVPIKDALPMTAERREMLDKTWKAILEATCESKLEIQSSTI